MLSINKIWPSSDCHLSDFTVSSIGDSAHVKMMISVIPITRQYLHVVWFTGNSNVNFEFLEFTELEPGTLRPRCWSASSASTHHDLKIRIWVACESDDMQILSTVWNVVEYCFDVCRITSGTQTGGNKNFESSWRWRQHGPPKRWYPTTMLYGAATQETVNCLRVLVYDLLISLFWITSFFERNF
jgi:hypothetical protein